MAPELQRVVKQVFPLPLLQLHSHKTFFSRER
jgi:hypothetical protein